MEQNMITNQGIFLKMIPDGQEMKNLIFKETQNSKSILEGILLQDLKYELRRKSTVDRPYSRCDRTKEIPYPLMERQKCLKGRRVGPIKPTGPLIATPYNDKIFYNPGPQRRSGPIKPKKSTRITYSYGECKTVETRR
ncbi:hypothetical protein E2I00_019114 [Balaenoptera physalus]|uniref:Uncharacterized protein n=1 Tax=Balaenoptera physalus TaxID=9770 RepID=A0A643CDU4_BALPH|nr:hypothetical protein E2I00_019114 [Balaenoptera physalus]